MKILRPTNAEDPRRIQKLIALKECEKCPYCGNSELDSGSYDYTKYHLFWKERYNTTKFYCEDCGCKFESDPYDFRSDEYDLDIYPLLIVVISILFLLFGLLMVGVSTNYVVENSDIKKTCGIVLMCIGLVIIVIGVPIILLCKNAYKRHTFYDEFKPIERHILTMDDIDSIKLELQKEVMNDTVGCGEQNENY